MIRRTLVLLLCAYLLAWVPLGTGIELLATLPSVAVRGPLAAIELAAHVVVALLSVIAGRMVLMRAPAGRSFAFAAVICAGATAVQSRVVSALPRDVAPGNRVPLVALAVILTVFWLIVIGRTLKDDGA